MISPDPIYVVPADMCNVTFGLHDLLTSMDTRSNGSQTRHIPDNIELEPRAVRMIPADNTQCVGTYMDGDRLLVAFATPPSEYEITRLETDIHTPVTVGLVSSPEVLEALRSRAAPLHNLKPELTETLLDEAIRRQATDLHLSVGDVPKVRVGGTLQVIPNQPAISKADLQEIAQYLASPEQYQTWSPQTDVDCAAPYAGWRLRLSLYHQMRSPAVAIRFVPRYVMSMEELGLPPVCAKMVLDNHNGLLLVCGITGSGKSTTLASMVDLLNGQRACHIITIEDPIEYVHVSRTSTIHQREIGTDTPSFQDALKHALRQDPDVILVGEMRDPETMQMALDAAETGHLVLATVHSRDAASTITRIVTSFPSDQQNHVRTQLADAIVGVVVQSLLPAANDPTGRRLVCEIMVPTGAVRNIIRTDAIHQLHTTLETGSNDGMQIFDRDLVRAVLNGQVNQSVARSHSVNPEDFDRYLETLQSGD